jgi:small-conductance mechanosensitive channel
MKFITVFGPLIGTILVVVLTLWAIHFLLIKRNQNLGNERLFPRQLIMLGLTLLGILVIILVMPINLSSRNQLIALFGIIISAVIALSSTTVISNLMAGVLLRMTKPFNLGDFIRIGDHFGRVSERGLFDTEIQTEMSELISLPNTYCISNPLTTIRSSGTIISASLSLSYEFDHNQIEQLLLVAAKNSDLTEPFVHIMKLGNFAVTYRISGFLVESNKLISRQSKLYGSVLDMLHSHNIEIMSPSYMNQRQINNERVIPTAIFESVPVSVKKENIAEDVAFNKADIAEKLENETINLKQEIGNLENSSNKIVDKVQKNAQKNVIKKKRKLLKSIEKSSNNSESSI